MKTMRDAGEFGLIAGLARHRPRSRRVLCGIGDDAAVVRPQPGNASLFTTDMLIEGVHFLRSQPAAAIGHKAIAASLSDIAAMAGVPEWALVSLGVPPGLSLKYVQELYRGMRRTCRTFGVEIIGGDTNRSDKIILAVFVSGRANPRQTVLRSGARPQDAILVTGRIGGAAAGGHLRFTPRVAEAQFLIKHAALHAMIDISDGLVQDLRHILTQSQVGAVLQLDRVPLSPAARSVRAAVTAGEDFELLFTAAERDAQRLMKMWPFGPEVPLTRIGTITSPQAGMRIFDARGRVVAFPQEGFRHF